LESLPVIDYFSRVYRKLIALAEFTIESCRKDNTGIFISILLALFNYLVSFSGICLKMINFIFCTVLLHFFEFI